jgi:hypothetical protein
VPQPAPEVAVAEELAAVAFERVAGGADAVDGQVGRFELFDQPAARLALDAAVEPAGEDRDPVVDRDPGLEVDLRAVAGVGRASLPEDAAVELEAEPEAPPPVSPVEADAPEPVVLRQLADGHLEHLRGLVKAQVAIIICG